MFSITGSWSRTSTVPLFHTTVTRVKSLERRSCTGIRSGHTSTSAALALDGWVVTFRNQEVPSSQCIKSNSQRLIDGRLCAKRCRIVPKLGTKRQRFSPVGWMATVHTVAVRRLQGGLRITDTRSRRGLQQPDQSYSRRRRTVSRPSA